MCKNRAGLARLSTEGLPSELVSAKAGAIATAVAVAF